MFSSLHERAISQPSHRVFQVRDGDRFVDRQLGREWQLVQELAKGLIASGVAAGDRVVLMAASRVEWMELDLAINVAGAVTVPVYETSSAEQLEWILEDSGAQLSLVEDDAMAALVEGLPPGKGTNDVECLVIEGSCFEELRARGTAVSDDQLQARVDAIDSDSISTIIYTSGTTGRPKGCVLTQANLVANMGQAGDAVGETIGEDDTVLIFLPLAHVLTKMTALFCLHQGAKLAFATSIANLPEELAMVRPTALSAVPRIFEKVFSRAQHSAEAANKGWLFERAADTAVRYSRQRRQGSNSWPTRVEHAVFDRLVYGKIVGAFGGRLRMAFSGGGPLGERLASFFDGAGVRIYEGYGLTETSPILTISRTDAWCPGSVGPPVVDTEIRFEDDGELLARGPQVFQGYWNRPDATAEALDADGWLHTGDVGRFDDEGFVHITGRKKDMIVTAAGKNVAPAPLEDRLKAHSLISQAMVIGDGRPFVAALLTIDADVFDEWASENGLTDATIAESASGDAVRKAMQEAVDDANRSVSRAESIRSFIVLPHDLSADDGEVTPTLKVRRMVVQEHYQDLIDSIYSSERKPT